MRITPMMQNQQRRGAPRVKASEEGLFKPITAKVSSALSDEYVEQIKACAREAAANGTDMVSSGYASMRDAQMGKCVSPDRSRAISHVSAALKRSNYRWKSGADPLPCTVQVFHGPVNGTAAQIFNEDGEMIAGYREAEGWITVPTGDETRFQYESNQIYREAYNAAKAEIEARQGAAPAAGGGISARLNVQA